MQNVIDKNFLIALGRKVKLARKQRGISQLVLGVKMNNHPEQISRIERGVHNVTICTLKKIADVLEVPISSLLPTNE